MVNKNRSYLFEKHAFALQEGASGCVSSTKGTLSYLQIFKV